MKGKCMKKTNKSRNPLIDILKDFDKTKENGIYLCSPPPGSGKTFAVEQAVIESLIENQQKSTKKNDRQDIQKCQEDETKYFFITY